jgi:iron complex outermembrane recepter protein
MAEARDNAIAVIAVGWIGSIVLALDLCVSVALAASPIEQTAEFQIPAGPLAQALNRFAEQSGLQTVYDPQLLQDKRAPALVGHMGLADALHRLLADSGLEWTFANTSTIAVRPKSVAAAEPMTTPRPTPPRASAAETIASLTDVSVLGDPHRVLPEASTRSFGFNKSLLDTPRAVSFISEETIDLFGLSAVENLLRVVPGVYTPTRFGIQGAVDIRSVPADTFFRGMKRLSLQGHGRSVLAAMDSIEIVRGPPSPLYGMGKIGGYTNLEPKSGRAKTGAYLNETQGFAQLILGDYERREGSFGVGGPLDSLQRFDRRGGYYVYGLGEDSNSYTEGVPIKQQLLQAAVSIDDFAGAMRLESGASYQVSRTAGALTGRLTQDLIDNARYIRGSPLVDLDANHNGAIGYYELHEGSAVTGPVSASNQPLIQTWDWPKDANGRPLPLGTFPTVAGIPQAMFDYLTQHPEADPTGLLRAQGVGGPLPQSGAVPAGMPLDPRTVGYDSLDFRRAAAFEKELKAEFITLFFDLIYDSDPNFTAKNQLFFDSMHQYKNSLQPFVQEQDVHVIEDKLTLTRRLQGLPPWLRMNALVSGNVRQTVSKGRSSGTADFSSHRTDAMASTWDASRGGMTPNTTFASPIDNPDLDADGFPWVSIYDTQFSEAGLGLMFDVDLFTRWNLIVGGRTDTSRARNTDYAGSFIATTGTSSNPGRFMSSDATASAWDSGTSWSVSLSYHTPWHLRPYVTFSESSIVLDGNNNQLTNATIEAGHLGSASLKEIGVKASFLDDRLFFSLAGFEQARTGVDADDDPALVYTYATATRARGWEMELKWVPLRNFFVSLYALHQQTVFDPNVGSTQLVDARTLGFQDVVDAQGNVIYPAEAFLYGGRSRIVLPKDVDAYRDKQGTPESQVGWSLAQQLPFGLGWTLSGNYLSSTCAGRLCTVKLPSSEVLNAGAHMKVGSVSFKVDVFNLTNERYFRARTGDTLGNVLAQAMPDRQWQFTANWAF